LYIDEVTLTHRNQSKFTTYQSWKNVGWPRTATPVLPVSSADLDIYITFSRQSVATGSTVCEY